MVPLGGEGQAVAWGLAAKETWIGEVLSISRVSNGGELGRESSEVELRRLAVGGDHGSELQCEVLRV